MKITEAYIAGWKALLQHKKMWLGLYGIQLFVAFFAAIPFSGFLGRTVGHSLDLTNSLGRFDYTFLNDFLLNYGSGFKALLNQSTGFILLYFILMAFLMGGILTILKSWKQTESLSSFFLGSGHFFWRILRLSVYFLFFQGILITLFGFLFLKATNDMSLFELENEIIIINAVMVLLPIYLILSSILFLIHDLAKLFLVQEDKYWLTSIIRDAFKKVFKQLRIYYPLYLLNILTFVFLTVIYVLVRGQVAPTSMGQVALVFVIGQLYLFFRMGLKVVNLGSLNEVVAS
ncbi:MAG: hypothetical protein ACI8YQ_004067 [Polaribacter sp.]|jgi:hypothetical protein